MSFIFSYMRGRARTREPVTITKKGKPVAKLVPADGQPEDVFGCLKDEIEIVGDILSPLDQPEDGEVLR